MDAKDAGHPTWNIAKPGQTQRLLELQTTNPEDGLAGLIERVTAITRGRKMVVLVGQKKALGLAVRNNRTNERFSGLLDRLRGIQA